MTYAINKGGINMPRGDGTGPMGRGPMSGRGMGFCVRVFEDGEASYIGGGIKRGFRCWLGRGCSAVPFTPQTYKEILERQKADLQKRIGSIEEELEKIN